MLPTTWKLYRIFNYVQLFYTILVLVSFIVAFYRQYKSWPNITGVVFVFTYFLLAVACIMNLANLARYSYNKILSGAHFLLHVFAIIIMCITWIGFVIISWTAISDAFGNNPSDNPFWKVLALTITLMCLVQLYIIIFQFRFPKFLRKKQNNSMNQLIDSIGGDSFGIN